MGCDAFYQIKSLHWRFVAGGRVDEASDAALLHVLYPTDPTQLPRELARFVWPPTEVPAPAVPPTPKALDFEQITREWLAGWNVHDLTLILNRYAEDIEFHSPFVTKLTGQADGTVRGKAALREYFARGLATYPTLRFEFLRLYHGARSCVLEYRSVHGLRAVETMEFDSLGKIRRSQVHYTAD